MIDFLIITIIGSVILFFSGMITGLTGFGLTLVSVPALIVFISPRTVVPMFLIQGILINVLMLFGARKFVDLKKIWLLILTGIIGTPLGTLLLIVLNISILKILVGIATNSFAVALLIGFNRKVKREKMVCAPVGFVSGVLNGSTSMGSPPIVLFFANQDVQKQFFRANLQAYFILINLAALPSSILGGLVTLEVIRLAIVFLPALVLGTVFGTRLVLRVNESLFRKTTLVVVMFSGAFAIISALGIF